MLTRNQRHLSHIEHNVS